jgi:hypothetical protein
MIIPIPILTLCLFIINVVYSSYMIWYINSECAEAIVAIDELANRLKSAGLRHMQACKEAMDKIEKMAIQNNTTIKSEKTEAPTSD